MFEDAGYVLSAEKQQQIQKAIEDSEQKQNILSEAGTLLDTVSGCQAVSHSGGCFKPD